jgi:DNA-binding HxlR family transcriptional regulator
MEAAHYPHLRFRPWRFNELRKDLEGISQKVLTDSLREMEADGIITRTVYPAARGIRALAAWRDTRPDS